MGGASRPAHLHMAHGLWPGCGGSFYVKGSHGPGCMGMAWTTAGHRFGPENLRQGSLKNPVVAGSWIGGLRRFAVVCVLQWLVVFGS